MMSKMVFESVDRTLKDICNLTELFSGKPFILSGEFFLILPIIKKGLKYEIISNCITKYLTFGKR